MTEYKERGYYAMDNKTVHDLAVAFAQVKLFRYLQESPDMNGYSDEIRTFVKAYTHACHEIPATYKDLDEHF